MKDNTLRSLLTSIFQIPANEASYVIDLCKNHRADANITQDKYSEIMDAVAAYKAIDICDKENINKSNYYLVVWLYERREPDEEKTKIGLDKLDADQNGCVTLMEWLAYLSVGDADAEFFMGHARKDFIKIDTDNSGFLEVDEVVIVLNSTITKWAKANIGIENLRKCRKDFNRMLKHITDKILSTLKKSKVDWESFQTFWDRTKEEMTKLKDFLLNTVGGPRRIVTMDLEESECGHQD